MWPKELKKWTNFQKLSCSILHGSKKESALKEKADIYLINPEGLPWLINSGALEELKPDTLIIDESSKFKNTQTQRFKTLKPWLGKFRRRWILTGSPTPNGLLDLFGQIFILDMGAALSPYITQYRRMFFDPSGYGGYEWKLKPDGAKRINTAIKPLILRLEDSDYLELPEIVDNDIYVDLPPAARKMYNQMERVLLTSLANKELITAANAGVASMKCSQIANGGVYRQGLEVDTPLVDSERWVDVHDAKAEAVADLVEELEGEPVLIGYEFDHDLARLRKVLPKDAVYVADLSAKQFAEVENRWNRGEITVLVGQTSSIAHGLNLQDGNARHLILHSLIWNYEDYMQFIRRIRRQGNKSKKVFVHRIIARDTVDEAKVDALANKHDTQYSFLTALKDYARRRS